MALAELDRSPRQTVEQRRRARVRRRPASRIDRGAPASGFGQTRSRARDLGLQRAGQNHAERVEQHQLGVLTDRVRNRFPGCRCGEPRQLLDLFAHRALRRPSKGLVPA